MNETELVSNPFAAMDDAGDPSIPSATLQIYQFIADYLERGKDTHVNRASSASMCPKRRWFQRQGFEGKPITPRKRVNFLLGDLAEKTMNYFVKQGCVGPGKLYSEVEFGEVVGTFTIQGKTIEVYKQQDLTADIGGVTVTAHVDGWGKRNSDGQFELIEFKSAANYGFSEFKDAGPGDYLKQSTVNLQTTRAKELGAKDVRFFYLRKETGHLYDRVFAFDPALAAQVAAEYLISNQEQEPESPYQPIPEKFRGKPTGRRTIPWQCQYCSYVDRCHRVTVEWKDDQWSNRKPVYIVKEEKADAV